MAVPNLVQEEVHSKETCPWHDEPAAKDAKEMDEAADDEDVGGGLILKPGAIPANSGRKLGESLGGKSDTTIQVTYPGSSTPKEEPLQWAPHHLIPGNASLKGSNIVPYLGDDTVIKKYGSGSKIKKGQTVGYNVNAADNGEWLPSPYALSMKGKWPTAPGDKLAYVVAAIDQNGGNAQFHMSHTRYSNKVQAILDLLADKLQLLTDSGVCDMADSSKSDKFDAPQALVARLHGISGQMRRFVTGKVWRAPLFTDDTLMAAYIDHKKMKVVKGLEDGVVAIKVGTR